MRRPNSWVWYVWGGVGILLEVLGVFLPDLPTLSDVVVDLLRKSGRLGHFTLWTTLAYLAYHWFVDPNLK